MGSPEIAVAVGRKQFIGSAEVEVVQKGPDARPHTRASRTARAEGAHITVAHNLNIETRWATVIPNHRTGSAGAMMPDVMHPTIAMAHAGMGDSHDRRIVLSMGANPESHARAAQLILLNDSETHEDVSTALDKRGTMGRSEILSVINKSREDAKERKIPKATIFIKSANGRQTQIDNVRVEGGSVVLPDTVVAGAPLYDITTHRRWSERMVSNAPSDALEHGNEEKRQEDLAA